MWTKEQIKTIRDCSNDFFKFTTDIFSESVPNFVAGDYVKKVCNLLSHNDRTIRIAARSHFKSVSFASYIMWKMMYGISNRSLDVRYFSYSRNLSSWHVKRIKGFIRNNPYFDDINDMKPIAESVLDYSWDKKNHIVIRSHGLRSFSRGLKTDILLTDDPYKEPENLLRPTDIRKVNNTLRSVIMESLNPGGELHLCGSPISRIDAWYDKDFRDGFAVMETPALVVKDGKEVPSWPEFYSLKDIKKKIKQMGEKIFQREMMIKPYYSEESYFKKAYLRKNIVNENLSNIKFQTGINTTNPVIAGLDIGGAKNPAGFTILHVVNKKAKMVHWKMPKGWIAFTGKPHWSAVNPSLLEYAKECIKNFGIDELYYDATRGEFASARAQGLVPMQMIPVVFNRKKKVDLANNFQRHVTNRNIEIINSEKLLDSICQMTNELIAITDKDGGHADMFVATELALMGLDKFMPSSSNSNKLSVGGARGFFEGKGKIPKNF